MKDNVEIALSSDARFYPGMFMVACSAAYYASRDVRLTFHLLDGGVGSANTVAHWHFVDWARFCICNGNTHPKDPIT